MSSSSPPLSSLTTTTAAITVTQQVAAAVSTAATSINVMDDMLNAIDSYPSESISSTTTNTATISARNKKEPSTTLMTVAFATAKRRRRLPNHKQLAQQRLEQMKLVTDTQEALQLLQLPTFHGTTSTTSTDARNANDDGDEDDEDGPTTTASNASTDHHYLMVEDDQVFVDALHLCSKARRHDVALAIYPDLCSTEACRQMAIYACGKCPGQEHHVLHLLKLEIPLPSTTTTTTTSSSTSTSTASIASYNTALTVLHWQRAYELLLNDMVELPPIRPNDDDSDDEEPTSVLDVLSCNIVLNAMAKAHRGEEALELWNSMTTTTTDTSQRQIFPRPDRTSWHHVMTACLSHSHRQQKHSDAGSSTPEQLQQVQQQARAVYFNLFLPHVFVVDPTDASVPSSSDPTHTATIYDHDSQTIAFMANHQTYDLLARGYSKMGDWDMVRMVEGHRKGHHQEQPTIPSTAPLLPPTLQPPPHSTVEPQPQESPLRQSATTPPLSSNCNNNHNKDDLEYQYYYFQHWTGMLKVGRGNTAYWILGTYHHYFRNKSDSSHNEGRDEGQIECSTWRVALQPNRNPSKNGVKLLFLVQDKAAVAEPEMTEQEVQKESSVDTTPSYKTREDRKTWKKLGYVLMINARNNEQFQDPKDDTNTGTNNGEVPTSTLLGLFIDPIYRKHGLSKTFLAIWLFCCRQARLQPQTGLIRKPLLALVLEHTFGFSPMLVSHARQRDNMYSTDGATTPQGVELEIYIPPDSSDSETGSHDDGNTLPEADESNNNPPKSSSITKPLDASAKIHLYSPHGKGLKGTFSPWDLLREGIVIDSHPPPPGSRGRRIIHLMCNFVSSMPEDVMEERIDSILSGATTSDIQNTSESSRKGNHLTLVLTHPELQNVFLGK